LPVFYLLSTGVFGPAALAAEEPNKALKYHAILQKRPEPGYVFDRFYNTWLDQASAESLQTFLQTRIEAEDSTPNRLLLAFFHSKQNDDAAAIDEFAEALKRDPDSASGWYYKARAESRTLDFESAAADLQEARRRNPDPKLAVSIERLLGTMLMRSQRTAEALAVWKALLDAHPADEELFEDVIELHLEESLFDEAAALSERLIAMTKDPYVAIMRRLRLGDVHHRAGRRDKAVEVYAAALGDSGDNSWLEREIIAQIEQLFRLEDDLTGLSRQYIDLLKTYPKRVGLHRRRCRLLVELGENDEALKGYRKILELTPGERGFREEYVDMLGRMGRHDEAVKELRSLREQHPKDPEILVRLAKTLHLSKKTPEAIEAVREYLKISDGGEYAHTRAARLVAGFGDRAKALEFHEKLAAAFPDSPSAQEALAGFLHANDRKEDALAIWRKLAEKADLTPTLNVARSLSARGENAVALELLAAREKDFGDNPLFLGQLVAAALHEKQYERCLPGARRRVETARSASELEAAVAQAVTAFKQSEKIEETIKELQAAPQRPVQLTCLLAELHESLGESERADEVLKIPAEQGETLAIGQQIRLHCLRGNWSAAAAATKRLLELSGAGKAQHVRRLVELYERDNQPEEALKWTETWKRLSPGSTDPWFSEARLLQLQGKEDEALGALRKAVQRFDKDDDLRAALAQAYNSAGKYREAERVYRQLFENTEDAAEKLRWVAELADIAQSEGTVPRLLEEFEQRRRTNRRSIVPLLALAEIHRATGEYEGRRQALLAATNLKPDDLDLLSHIARIEESEGDWKAAAATLERAAKLDPTGKTRQKIARLHLEYGEPDAGLAILRDMIDEKTADPRALEGMADALCGVQEWERAADFLRERISAFAGDYRLRYLLAVAYEEAGRFDEAAGEFVRLLENLEELPEVKQNAAKIPARQSQFDEFKDVFPSGAMQMFEVMEARESAYAHRENRHAAIGYPAGLGMGSLGGSITMPSRVEEVFPFALTHLLTMAKEFDEPRQAALLAELKSRGVRSPKILLDLADRLEHGPPPIDEELKENPDDELLLTIAVLSGFDGDRAVDAEPLVRAYEKFRRKHFEFAFIAALQAASCDQKHAPLLGQALEQAAQIERPNPLLIMGIATGLGGEMMGRGPVENAFEKEHRDKLVKLMIGWYPKMSQGNAQYGPFLFYIVVRVLRSEDDPAAYFAFLEGEVARHRENAAKAAGQNLAAMFFSGRSDSRLLAPLGFPPEQLTDFPPNVRSLLSPDEDGDPFSRMMADQVKSLWEPEKLKPLIEKVKDPTLRLLLAHQSGQTELVDAILKQMLAERTPRLDAYLLAAGKAEADDEYAETVRLLEKARHLPMKKDQKQRIDAAVVTAVFAAKENDAADEELLKAGRDAALRLRRQRLDKSQREQLVSVLEDLGLKKEAESLEKRLARALGGLSFAPPAFVAPGAATPSDRIENLIADDKRELAARMLANNLKQIGQQVAANPGENYYMDQVNQFRGQIEALDMLDEVLSQFKPKDGGNPLRVREYALASELLGRKKEAVEAYLQVLERRPKDDEARCRLILLMAGAPGTDWDEHLDKLSDAAIGGFGMTLARKVNDYDTALDERFRHAEIAMRLLTKLKERPRAETDWAGGLADALGDGMHSNRTGASLPSLYAIKVEGDDDTKENEDAKFVAARKRMEELHRELCEMMLDMPNLQREGFRRLLAAAEARGDVPRSTDPAAPDGKSKVAEPRAGRAAPPPHSHDDFIRFAQKILLDESSRRLRRTPSRQTIIYNVFLPESDPDKVRFRSPEEYLARSAWSGGDWRLLDEELLPKLAEGVEKQPHKSLARLVRLYRCPAEEYLAAAEEVVKEFTRSSATFGQDQNEAMTIVVEVWADRSLAVDLEPMIVDFERRNLRGRGMPTEQQALVRFLETLVSGGMPDKVRAVLAQITELYLGPENERIEFVRKHYNQRNVTYGTPNGRIHAYFAIMESLARNESLVLPALAAMEPIGELVPWDEFHYYPVNNLESLLTRKPEKILAALEASPWLGDLERFRVMPNGGSAGDWPLVKMLSHANDYRAEELKPFWAILRERQEKSPSFGMGLLLAAAASESKKTALLEHFGKHLDDIRKLPQKRQSELAALAAELIGDDPKPSTDAARSTLEWMAEHRASRCREFLDKLDKAKRLEDFGPSVSSTWEQLAELLPLLLKDDPQAAKNVFFKMLAFAEDYTKRNGAEYYLGGDRNPGGCLLEKIIDDSDSAHYPRITAFLLDATAAPEGERIVLYSGLRHSINNMVRSFFNEAEEVENPFVAEGHETAARSDEADLKRFYRRLGACLNGRPAALLIPSITVSIRWNINSKEEFAKLADWAKAEMASGEHPALVADLCACLLLCGRRGPAAKESESADPPAKRPDSADVCEHFRKLLGDAKLPLSWRYELAAFAAGELTGEDVPAELTRNVAAVYTAAIDKAVPIEDSEHAALLNVLSSLGGEPESEALRAEWSKQFARRYLRGGRSSAADPSYSLDDAAALNHALALYLGAGDEERANLLLRKYEDELKSSTSAVAQLVRFGKCELASRLFRKQTASLDFSWSSFPVDHYRQEIADNLPEFLGRIANDDERLLAEITLATMPTAEDAARMKDSAGEFPFLGAAASGTESADASAEPPRSGLPGRDARLAALAPRLKSTKFRNKMLRTKAIVGLIQSRPAAALLVDEVAAEYKNCGIVLILHGDNNARLREIQPLVLQHVANRLSENDVQPFLDLMEKLAAASSSRRHYHYYTGSLFHGPLVELCCKALDRENVSLTAGQAGEIADALFGLLQDEDSHFYGHNREFNMLLLLAHLQAGRLEKLIDASNEMSVEMRGKLSRGVVSPDVWAKIPKMSAFPAKDAPEQRIGLLGDVLQIIFKHEWFHWSTGHLYGMCGDDINLFDRIVKAEVVSDEELIEHGPAMVEKLEDAPLAKACLASWLQAKKEFAKAEPLWRSAIAKTPADKKTMLNYYNWGLYNTLEAMDRRDEAEEVRKQVDIDSIEKQHRHIN